MKLKHKLRQEQKKLGELYRHPNIWRTCPLSMRDALFPFYLFCPTLDVAKPVISIFIKVVPWVTVH